MIKYTIITAYIIHKIHWKRKHRERIIKWNNFFGGV